MGDEHKEQTLTLLWRVRYPLRSEWGYPMKHQSVIRGMVVLLPVLSTSTSQCWESDFQKCKLAEPRMPQSNLSHQFLSSIIPSPRGQSIRYERLPVRFAWSSAEFDSVSQREQWAHIGPSTHTPQWPEFCADTSLASPEGYSVHFFWFPFWKKACICNRDSHSKIRRAVLLARMDRNGWVLCEIADWLIIHGPSWLFTQ